MGDSNTETPQARSTSTPSHLVVAEIPRGQTVANESKANDVSKLVTSEIEYPSQDENSGDYPQILDHLISLDHLFVHQEIEPIEALTGFETNNQYVVKNSSGKRVYFAAEKNWCCTRLLCGSGRSFVIKIVDPKGNEVIRIHRPFKCTTGICPCCLQELVVESPPKNIIGYVAQTWNPIIPSFNIQNENKEKVLILRGPFLLISCCGDVTFKVKSRDGSKNVGRISKRYGGLIKELTIDADSFGVQFPKDLDVKMKAILLGACFLLDFLFFENFECPDVPCVSGV